MLPSNELTSVLMLIKCLTDFRKEKIKFRKSDQIYDLHDAK